MFRLEAKVKFEFLTLFVIFLVQFHGVYSQDAKECPTIVKRAQWGASKSTNVTYQIRPVVYVVIHHTATAICSEMPVCKATVKSIQDQHQKMNGWSDIGYNFLIGNGGVVYEGIGWHRVGAHTRGYNSKSLGIAFIGEFTHDLPSARALRAVNKLLECGVSLGELHPDYMLYGARQISATASPGTALYGDLQEWDHYDPSPVV
ncbi:peptidoglycan-recognition protein 2-like [Uranotaenia lowii]|uniref:peptidoglycan-recognition protein 2-like n=1 Tax=Uranotaenia lowii TaxID=190385 RepID=UPI00247858E5|nr:peptidoglycan-recognition protein 2-like [Uranotaenia lowii]